MALYDGAGLHKVGDGEGKLPMTNSHDLQEWETTTWKWCHGSKEMRRRRVPRDGNRFAVALYGFVREGKWRVGLEGDYYIRACLLHLK